MTYIDNIIKKESSKIGFLFISFVVIASGYVTQVLPCQTHIFLRDSDIGKHIVGILICFLFIMLEGGWSFNMEEQNKADVDWSNGNVIDTMVFGTLLYGVFLLTSKMKLIPNVILYTLLFSVYLMNAQRLYWENRELINQEENDRIVNYIKYALSASLFVFLYGIIDYFIYEKNKHKMDFSTFTFLFSSKKCRSLD